jgi:alpha-ketoglutarate-dependent 2,4-dichlorophenoxyacetate dioxygenase
LVRLHPGSKRKTLYLSAHASHVIGGQLADGRLLLLDLTTHSTRQPFIYLHNWRVGDVIIWDNRCTIHRGRPHDEHQPRDLLRATTLDIGSTLREAA